MNFNEYQQIASKTAIYPEDLKVIYPALGLSGEVGEVCEKIKKTIRDFGRDFNEERKQEIIKELGDVLWYISAIATDLGYNLEDIAKSNIEKITKRKLENKIHGEGDNR